MSETLNEGGCAPEVDSIATVDSDAVGQTGASEPSPAAPVAGEPASCEPVRDEPAPDPAAEAAAEAERALREAEELAARRAAAAEEHERRAQKAVASITASAGFVTSAGAYYDVKAADVASADAAEAARALEVAERAAAERARQAQVARQDGSDPAADKPAEPVPAQTDLACEAPDEGSYVDEADFNRRVARLTAAVARQSLHREILYKVLVFCQESRGLQEVEQEIASYPAFKHAANNPYHFIEVLEQAGGLERFELDEEGEVVTPERKEGLDEDGIDDLVAGYAFMTTPVGMAVVEQHTPRARIIELLDLVPERKDAYIELLEFCSEEPRTYNEINQLFSGRDVLVRMVDGEPQTMQPSVFVDKLEAAAGIEWDNGWVLTEEGRSFLAELHEL